MKFRNLDPEEKEILKSFKNEELVLIENSAKFMERYRTYAAETIARRSIS
jgi:hypothetical protein